ncbi:MAG: hypothetical protein M3313_13630 [Actinomycetota bacterium]|nr:hypothetical protein [Actinomycetota bacterium]
MVGGRDEGPPALPDGTPPIEGEMRWARLFADLEAQLQAEEAIDLASEVASRTRHESGQLSMADRLRAAVGHPVRIDCTGVGELGGTLQDVGTGWLLLDEGRGREVLVNLSAVGAVQGLSQRSASGSHSEVGRRLDLRYAIRGLTRDRSPLQVLLTSGQVLTGTFDRVGSDFVELAEHLVGELRRPSEVRAVRMVSLSAVAAVRTILA